MPLTVTVKKKNHQLNQYRNISYIRTPGSPFLFRGSPFTGEILIYVMHDLIPG